MDGILIQNCDDQHTECNGKNAQNINEIFKFIIYGIIVSYVANQTYQIL